MPGGMVWAWGQSCQQDQQELRLLQWTEPGPRTPGSCSRVHPLKCWTSTLTPRTDGPCKHTLPALGKQGILPRSPTTPACELCPQGGHVVSNFQS